MSLTRFPLLTFVIVLTIVGVVISLSIFVPKNVSNASPNKFPPTNLPPMHPAPGITPKTNAAVAFGTQDVQQYVLTHEFPAGAVVPGHTIKIISIKLMTRQQADEQGHELDAYTTTNMVYVVYVDGPFYTTYVKTLVGVTSTVLEGYEIFDAHTGDVLEWGLPSL